MEYVVGFENLCADDMLWVNGGNAIADIAGGITGIATGYGIFAVASEMTGTTILTAACVAGMGLLGSTCIVAGAALTVYGVYQIFN